MQKVSFVQKKANELRIWSLKATTAAGSGHPTTCLSAADIAAVLFDKFFTTGDRFVLSKGHASPLLYAIYAMAGAFPKEKLMALRSFKSDLEGHPTPRLPFVEAATGSLGQGLSVAAGIAFTEKQDGKKTKVYTLLGDGEMAEGAVWEAANFASFYDLTNLIAIVDVNRLGQSGQTMFGHDLSAYARRFLASGWDTAQIDGHNMAQIESTFSKAQKAKKPFAIIAKTFKGRGVSFLEDKDGWHGKPLKKEELEKALLELGSETNLFWDSFAAKKVSVTGGTLKQNKSQTIDVQKYEYSTFSKEDKIATREQYGISLVKLGKLSDEVYALDAEVKNSTFSQDFKKEIPDRFIECYIAEQNMIGLAIGLSASGKTPFVSTFACFLTRAFDQIRMAAVSGANIKVVGSHAGVSIGEDGPSQMGLEDIAMFGVFPNTVVLHPADAVATDKLVAEMAGHLGIVYLRTLRPKTPILYNANEQFPIGGSKLLRSSKKDALTVVACGITVFEALSAYEKLAQDGVMVKVIDCYSLKPIDKKTLVKSLQETKQKTIITVEDHFTHGGLGDFVLDAVTGTGARVEKLAVSQISRSGKPEELLDAAGISARHIAAKVKSLV